MKKSSGRARLATVLCGLELVLQTWPTLPARAQGDDGKGVHVAQAGRHRRKRPRAAEEPTQADDAPSEAAAPGDAGEDALESGRNPPVWDDDDSSTPAAQAPAQQLGSADDEEVISDPELDERAGTVADDKTWGGFVPDPVHDASASAGKYEHDPLANTGLARLELIGQQGVDIHHEGALEDAYESRLRFDAEIDFRRSRKLRLSVGTRADLLWALPARGDPALNMPGAPGQPAHQYSAFEQDRWELDILPLSAYVDTTLGSSFHLRVGEQTVSIRRMDFFSPIDILAAFDLRGQPKLDPTSGRLAQPAVRVDWDLSSWATLQVVYLPWFMPNLSRPNRDRYVASILGTGGPNAPRPSRAITELVDPSFETKASEQVTRFVGPEPDFTTPQAQARLTTRGSGFELGFSAGTALEKSASFYLTPMAERFIKGLENGDVDTLANIRNGLPVAAAEYHRYTTFGLDGSVDIAPATFAFELAFSPSRHLIAATKDGSHLPLPNVSEQIVDATSPSDLGNVTDKSIRKGVPLLQAALHLDYLKGETFAVAVEGFMIKALQLPYDLSRDWWGFIPDTGIFAGGLIGGTYRPDPDQGRWRFDLSLTTLVGPSFIALGQVEWKAMEGFYLNMGAQIFEGPEPLPGGAQRMSLGGLFSGYDQMFFGFRYLP